MSLPDIDRDALIVWCDEEASDAQDSAAGSGSDRDYGCEQCGRAEAFREMAARLRGEKKEGGT